MGTYVHGLGDARRLFYKMETPPALCASCAWQTSIHKYVVCRTNKIDNVMKYPYYVTVMVCDASHGNMALTSQPQILENLPKNDHINLMWHGFSTRGEAQDYLKRIVKEKRFI